MLNWSSAAQGLRDSAENDTRKRQELAQAFAQYRAANPYASVAEFQDFIDSYSGGRNYIAGGAPSASILRAIGLENQKKKAEAEMRQRLADIQTRQQTIQSLQQLADNAMLNMEGDDFASVRDQVVGQFGPDGANALSDFNVNSMFTPSRLQTLRAQRMRDLLPGVLDLARTQGGVLKPSDISGLYPDIPKSLIEPLVAEAERVREQDFAQKKRELITGAIEFARANEGKLSSSVITGLYPGIPQNMIEPIVEEAKRTYQQELDEKAKKEALEVANTKTNLRTSLLQDPNFMAAVRSGKKPAAARIVNDLVKPYASALPTGTFDASFADEIIGAAEQGAEQTQLAEHQKLYADAQSKQNEAITQIEKDSMSAINLAFRASENGTPSMRAGGDALHNSNSLFAAQKLGTMFDASQAGAIDILTNVFSGYAGQGKSIEELTQLGAAALAQAGVPTLEMSKRQAAMSRGLNIPEMKSFSDWRSETEADIRSDFSYIDDGIQKAIRITDPKALQAEIANLARGIEQTRNAYNAAIQDARLNQNIWIPVGSDGWDDTQVFGKQGTIQAVLDAEVGKLNEKLNALTQHASLLAQRGSSAPQGNGNGPPPSGSQSPSTAGATRSAEPQTGAQRFMGAVNQDLEATKALRSAMTSFGTGGTSLPGTSFGSHLYDWLFTSTNDPTAFARKQALASELQGFLERPEAKQYLLEHMDTLPLLRSDPVAWAMQAYSTQPNFNPSMWDDLKR